MLHVRSSTGESCDANLSTTCNLNRVIQADMSVYNMNTLCVCLSWFIGWLLLLMFITPASHDYSLLQHYEFPYSCAACISALHDIMPGLPEAVHLDNALALL